jgi:HAD superfamily hydrolase (TIGR01509 family)
MTEATDRRPSAPRALAIDLDGTLVDTVETRIRAWLTAFEEARIPASRERISPLIGSDGKRLATVIAGDAGMTLDDARAEAIDKRSGELFDRLNEDPQPLPGARDLLRAADERRIPWAIATSSRREQVERSIAALGLERRPTIVDGSSVRHAKPAPDLFLKVAEVLGVEPGRSWSIGDATWDVQASIAAGMVAVGVLAGSAVGEAALRRAGAALVVPTLEELIPLLDEA